MIALRRAAMLAALCALASCGGGGSASLPAAGSSVASAVTPFAITLPAATDVTRLGIVSSIEPGTPEHSVPVTPSSSGCSTSGTTRVCAVALKLPLGAQVLTVNTYGTKTIHSSWRTTLAGTRVALAVGTAIAQISLDLSAPQLAGGIKGAATLYVTARDANGNTIVGDFGGASIAITDTDTTNSVTLSATTVTAGGTPITVVYNGSGSLGSVTFNATSSGVAATAIVAATLTFTTSQLMYATAGSSVLVFPAGASGDVPPLQRITIPGQDIGGGVPDGHGNIWIVTDVALITQPSGQVFGGQTIGSVPVSANGVTTPTQFPTSSFPANIAILDVGTDGSGAVYVLGSVNSAMDVLVFPAGSQTASRTIALGQRYCEGISVQTDGTFATNCIDSTYTVPSILVFAPGATAPTRSISGPATTLNVGGIEQGVSYVALAADGTIVTNDYAISPATGVVGTGALDIFAPGSNGSVAPARVIAGAGTGLNVNESFVRGPSVGVGIDASGAIYAVELAAQAGTSVQIARWPAGTSGAVVPASALGGPLTDLSVVNGTIGGSVHFAQGVVAPSPATTPSVSGDFLALTPNRGWNYTLTPVQLFGATPPPPTTLSLYSDPNTVNGETQLVALELAGVQTTAIGQSGAVLGGELLLHQGPLGGWVVSAYAPISDQVNLGGYVPIPGDLGLTKSTLTLGESFAPYLGITATVVAIGTEPGSTACPGGAATGATVAYTAGQVTETVGFVPGCGITYFVSDNGSTAVLTSVGTYGAGQLSHERSPASVRDVQALRNLWSTIFTPWRQR